MADTLPTPPTPAAITAAFDGAVPTDLADLVGLLANTPAMDALVGDYLGHNKITNRLFTERMDAPNGSYSVQQRTAQKATSEGGSTPFGTIAPGGAFPLAETGQTAPVVGTTSKIGAKAVVTLEALKAYRVNAITRATQLVTNTYSDDADAASIAALVSQIVPSGTGNRAVAGDTLWSAATSTTAIVTPIAQAVGVIKNARLGLNPNVLVISELNAAILKGNGSVAQILAFSQDKSAPIYTGDQGSIYGLEIVTVPDSLVAGTQFANSALVADANLLGGLAETIPFRVEVNYQGPNFANAEAWIVSVAHNYANYVHTPDAGCWITSIF